MVFHCFFFRVSVVLLSDLDHLLPILEGPLWACDSFVSGPFLPVRALSGQQMALQRDRGRLEGPSLNRTALCRPERALRSVLYQAQGPSVGLGGPSVGIGRSEGPSVGLWALYLSGRALCRAQMALCRAERALCRAERTLCRAERALRRAERALCRSERALQSVLCQFLRALCRP